MEGKPMRLANIPPSQAADNTISRFTIFSSTIRSIWLLGNQMKK